MLVDRMGRQVSPLLGPSAGGYSKPATVLPDEGDWKWGGWRWDPRSLHWLPSWRNAVLSASAVEGAGYWRVTGRERAYGTGDTFQEAWSAMVRREFAAEDAKAEARKPAQAPVAVWAR